MDAKNPKGFRILTMASFKKKVKGPKRGHGAEKVLQGASRRQLLTGKVNFLDEEQEPSELNS